MSSINNPLLGRCDVLSIFSHLLLVVNSSINIVIYCWKDEKFRKVTNIKYFSLIAG